MVSERNLMDLIVLVGGMLMVRLIIFGGVAAGVVWVMLWIESAPAGVLIEIRLFWIGGKLGTNSCFLHAGGRLARLF